jgi:PleD family two-component response regulator
VSFGVTQLRPGDNMDSLIRRADGLLYAAKQKGRNRVETDM